MTSNNQRTDSERIALAAEHARLLCNALAALPEGIPVPTHVTQYTHKTATDPQIEWLLFGDKHDYDEQKRIASEVIRAMGGKWDKDPGGLFGFETTRLGVQFRISVNREAVCERIVTGTREVTRTVPAPDAPLVEITETVEDVEWVCEPLLAEVTA